MMHWAKSSGGEFEISPRYGNHQMIAFVLAPEEEKRLFYLMKIKIARIG